MQNRVSNMQRAWFLFSHSISLASGFFCCASLWHPDTSHASSTKSRCPCELHGIFSSNHYKQTPQATLSSPIPLWRWMQYCWVWSAPVFIAFMKLKPHEICTISSSFSSEINKKVKKKKRRRRQTLLFHPKECSNGTWEQQAQSSAAEGEILPLVNPRGLGSCCRSQGFLHKFPVRDTNYVTLPGGENTLSSAWQNQAYQHRPKLTICLLSTSCVCTALTALPRSHKPTLPYNLLPCKV